MTRSLRLSVHITDDMRNDVVAFNQELAPWIAQAIRPLSRDRELGGWAAIDAMEQLNRRRDAAKAIAEGITVAIMEMIESKDPVNGYEVHERASMAMANVHEPFMGVLSKEEQP